LAYAEVSVNSPLAQRRTFSYSIPFNFDVKPGQAVWVPFGNKTLQGIIIELADLPAVAETREIAGLIESGPLFSAARLQLGRWLSDYYLAPLFDSLALMLPPGFERNSLTYLSLTPAGESLDSDTLSAGQRQVLELLRNGPVGQKQLEKQFGKNKAQSLVARLVREGLAERSYRLEPVKVRPRQALYLELNVSAGQARAEAAEMRRKRAPRQAELLEHIIEHKQPVAWSEVRKQTGASKAAANALAERGLVTFRQVEVIRPPVAAREVPLATPPVLTLAQKTAVDAIKASLDGDERPGSGVFLLYGITGSGKTEVYLQSLAETVKQGKRGIVLVPEISLTPQTIERFSARFPGRVAVLHSQLTPGEQFDEWRRINDGEFDVVIGPRSALFAPQPDLGLIVIDEEHEWTYKQENTPAYHARTIAIELARLSGATVVLGSATPDVESFYRAENGEYRLLSLPERVAPGAALPPVEIVDMREELKAGNTGVFSRALNQAINETVARNEQVILFLNRRGAATFIQCRACGLVLRCRRCNVPLAHHPATGKLVCHQCNYRAPVPDTCPRCGREGLKFLGAGTQKLARETDFTFPHARMLRWDSDAVRDRHTHQATLDSFQQHRADILVGTQMVAKGLDLPLVTLVGVVSADTGLNLPDFRAGERTFQLLSQVAGRAGRGPAGGRVIIQTFAPQHYAIQAAASHDYEAFYRREIEYRRQLRNPPFNRLARLVYSHTNEAACRQEAYRCVRQLNGEILAQGLAGLSIIGPAPAFIERRRGRYRWQIILRGPAPDDFLGRVAIPQGWTVDVDPVGIT
jgi:primosomal protein N' (replication factor Y)